MTLDYENIINQIDALLEKKEWREVEFKSAKGGFPGSFWETYSALANTEGGVIVLGVKEKDGRFTPDGLTEEQVEKYKRDFWSDVNNTGKVSVNLLMERDLKPLTLGESHLLVFRIPLADRSQRPVFIGPNPYNGTFKRNNEGDFKCTADEVRRMFADANINRPADSRILRGYSLADIDQTSLNQYRRLMSVSKPEHPWLALDDIELLTKLGGYRKDRVTGEEGFTVAGLLMFGKTESITDNECVPFFFPDYRYYPSLKQEGVARWTDRICPDGLWEANLFQFYRRVLPKLTTILARPFVLDEDTRIDETTTHVAIREALINLCIHADYSINASLNVLHYPTRIILSNPGTLLITREQYYRGGESVCRNKALQNMFSMLGKSEKAGSGVDKILQGWRDSHWPRPEISFTFRPDKVELSLDIEKLLEAFNKEMELRRATDQAANQVIEESSNGSNESSNVSSNESSNVGSNVGSNVSSNVGSNVGSNDELQPLTEKQQSVIKFCETPRTAAEIFKFLGVTSKWKNRQTYINALIQRGLIGKTTPDSPKSPTQKYITITQPTSKE